MAYIDWWNRTGPITLGERFGLNEISTRAKTLSPTKSHTAESVIPSQFDEISLEEMEDIKKQAGVGEQVKKDPYPWDKPQPPWWEDVHEPAPWDAKDGGRIGLKFGGSWADWKSNHEDQMTFEEYLKMDMPKPVHPIDKSKSTGGRVDMKPGGIVEPGVTHYAKKRFYTVPGGTMKEKHKVAYDTGYKFYKDKGIKITDKIEELIRKNVSVNKGEFIPPKFSGLLYEGISSRLPDYTLKMLKKDLKAGKTSHQIAIEYFKAHKKNVLKHFEGTKQFKQPLSALSTTIGNVINDNKELSKLYKKIIKDNSFKSETGKAKYIKDIETLLPFLQEKGILVVDERGKAIKNANDYFRYAYRTVSEPISKLFGYYETIGIEHPAGVSRAVVLEDANTLNRIIATIPETNTIKSKLDIHATGQAQFFKNIGDSKYIKNLNKITKKMNEEFATPRVVTDVKKGEAVVRPMEKLSLTKPNLFHQTKGYIMQKLAAGGFNTSHFNKLAPDLQKAIKAFEGGNLIKGNKYLKAAMIAAGLVLTTAGTTREKGMTTQEMKEKTSQFLEPDDEKVEAGTSLGEYILGGAGIGVGTAASKYGAWNVAKALGRWGIKYPLAASAVPFWQVGGALVETIKAAAEKRFPDYKLDDWQTWMHGAFWDWGIKTFGLDKMSAAFGESFQTLSKMDKARVVRNVAARGLMNPKTVQFISKKIAWPVTGALAYQGLEKWVKENVRKTPLTELEQKDIQKRKEAVPTMIGITEQAYKRSKQEGITYEDALKKIKQELADKETPLDIPGIEFKDKDELAMGGIASLLK